MNGLIPSNPVSWRLLVERQNTAFLNALLRICFGCLLNLAIFARPEPALAALIWSDLGSTQVHETGAGVDILGGALRRDDSSSDTLYFKFHVDPQSDANTEFYSAAFQLFEGSQERLAVGNALMAWAYSAYNTGETGPSNKVVDIDLNSSTPEPSGIGTFYKYELVRAGIERTIVFKVQYVPGGDDLVTVWLNPDLSPGATETSQLKSLTTQFKANASFNQIHLCHNGGGNGWTFSEMAIATSFGDFVNPNGVGAGGRRPFMFRSWQREQGLPENYVRALAQTRDGYIWVGTDEGVGRFDGVNFFSLGPQEGFQGGPVQVLYGDSRGRLWVGSVGGGLSYWEQGKLSKINVQDGLPSDWITALAEDREGRIWIGTQSGLTLWHNEKLATLPGAEIFSNKPITTIFSDRSGKMWVGATGAGIYSYQQGKFTPLHDPALDNLFQDPHCLLVDAKGRIWIGAGYAFVLCLDAGQWRRFGIPRHLATHYISSLAEGPDGTVWAGSVGEGLFEFTAGRLVVANASSGLSDNLVETLLVDREGKLWVGTHSGLNRLYPKKISVLSYDTGLNYGEVQGLAEISPGIIWASQPDGIYQWDGETFRRLFLDQLRLEQPACGALLAARDGSGWIAEARGMLQFTNPLIAEKNRGNPALTNLVVSAMAEGLKGEVWVGTREGTIWFLHGGKWRAQNPSPAGHPITALAVADDGTLWVGTEGDGLYQITVGAHAKCEKVSGLPGSWIRMLYLDVQGTLWIGTDGDGLSRLKDGRIATFTKREGLADNTISQILEDNDGNLWLGGDRGIFRIAKHDLNELAANTIPAVYPQIYGIADGMLSEECASGFFPAGLKTAAGMLWIPTRKGIVVIDPRHVVSSPPPAVVLEQVLVDGLPDLSFLNQPDLGSKAAPESANTPMESIRLTPGRHTLEFRFTGLSFDAPERVRFRYRLEGLDPHWVEAGTRRVAFYSFLPPGNYRFQVTACNGDGVWNQSGANLGLEVVPHFWQTRWFIWGGILGLGIVGTGGVWLVEKRRIRQRLRRLEQERALERERTRIAQDLHDIMGAKLCRISFLSEHARRSDNVPSELREEILSMSDDSREVLRSLDEIVWAVNPQKDTLDHLISYIAQYAEEYFRNTGIECLLSVPLKLPVQPLSSQSRHHLFLAVHESLTNVLKHSQATQITINMACINNDFEINISDNGIGFDPVAIESNSRSSAAGFRNGLGNMRQRISELGGCFEIESKLGKGTTIRFVLPLNKTVR